MKGSCNQNIKDKMVIIYGAGRILERYKEYICWENVVAIVDADIEKQGKYLNGKKIESPEKILKSHYDYIVICSKKFFEIIKIELIGNFFVPQEKIVSWNFLKNYTELISNEGAEFYKKFVEDNSISVILDVGNCGIERYFISNDILSFKIDKYGLCQFPLYNVFFDNIYSMDCKIEKTYDVILLWEDYEKDIKWDCLMQLAGRYIVWTIPYGYKMHKNFIKNIKALEKWGEKQVFLLFDNAIYVFKKKNEYRKINCEIYVVSHKKYNVISNEIYKPIIVGNQYENINFYSEHSGKNIAYLNDRINECTALYWIWKNTNSEYVGLNHYRRYFYNNEIENYANYLTEEKILAIFQNDFDIILPKLTRLSRTIVSNIETSIGKDLSNNAFKIVYNLLKERAPSYVDAFEYVLKGNVFYKCQMFITKRSVMNSYCEWLFSFLIDAAEQLDVSSCDAHQKRTMGYYAETLLIVWLLKQNIKIKELPITNTY